MASSLFEKAKNSSEKKKAEKHEIVSLPSLEKDLLRLAKLNADIADLEAERVVVDGTVREAGKEAMVDFYKTKKRFSGSLKVIAGKMSFLFITSDRYKKIEEDRFKELQKQYGKKLVEESTTYSFNTEILEKHMDHISKLLMGSKILSEHEKENLLTASTSYTVKKGTINELVTYGKDIEEMIADIQPVFSIKAVQEN
jgi:hypothetical protein